MIKSKFFQRAASQQFALRPKSPEGDLRPEETSDIQRVHAFGRRQLMHVVKVFGKQRADSGAGEVVDSNLHVSTMWSIGEADARC